MNPIKIKYNEFYIIFYFDDNVEMKVYANSEQYWYKNGKHHRDNDLPAKIYANGKKFWYKNGVRYEPNKD